MKGLSLRERAINQMRTIWLMRWGATLPGPIAEWPADAQGDLEWCERELRKEEEAAGRARKGLGK